jgi:hypothetical protein
MIQKTTAILILIALLGLNTLPVHAARSLSKRYKVSVTLPAAVIMPTGNALHAKETDAIFAARQTTEEWVIRNSEKILLRTTVVQ